jgi:hypothetical protein
LDRFYTPKALAATLVENVASKQPRLIADFAAGDGSLLAAASSKWPSAKVIAADIHEPTVRRLRRKYPKWAVLKADFLGNGADRVRGHCSGKLFDVILLNPPFSCRGASTWSTTIGGEDVRSGRAMAFVLRALGLLAADGELLAILPAGSISSQKDERAWAMVRERATLSIVQKNGYRTFEGCYPKTVMVRLKKAAAGVVLSSDLVGGAPSRRYDVVRGGRQVHRIVEQDRGAALVHSTSLQNGRIVISRRVSHGGRLFVGPAVLIPRVGAPNVAKVAVLRAGRRCVLTDCVLAIRGVSTAAARGLQLRIREHWEDLERRYRGTCAQYLTVRDLELFLEELP